MKKSQILAALALAFALGVVAPISSASAKIVETLTEDQQKSLDEKMLETQKAYNNLEKVNQYQALYNAIDAANGVQNFLNAQKDKVVKDYNDGVEVTGIGTFNVANINNAINEISKLETASGLYATNNDGTYVHIATGKTYEQALLANMPKLATTTSDAVAAYNAVKSLYTTATENLSIINQNYNTPVDGDVVSQAKTQLEIIIAATTAFMNDFQSAFANTGSTQPDGIATQIQTVSTDVYNSLVNSNDWKNATNDAYTTNFVRFNLAINAARALPKYASVNALSAAYVNFGRINDPAQEVRYDKALQYINELNTAIANYKNGTTTNPGDQQPTDPDTKPGDDSNKDDNKTPTSPDTGILSTAEGSASTTISIVAGLATALTALGAGVVAYRNARRSSEK